MKQESSGHTPDKGVQPETLGISDTNPILKLLTKFPYFLTRFFRKENPIQAEITQQAQSSTKMLSEIKEVDPTQDWMSDQGWQG